jgi:hypothetical protein
LGGKPAKSDGFWRNSHGKEDEPALKNKKGVNQNTHICIYILLCIHIFIEIVLVTPMVAPLFDRDLARANIPFRSSKQ